MNRRSILLRIVLLGVAVVALLGVLAFVLNRGFFIGSIRTGDLKLVHEQSVSADGLQNIALDFGSMEVVVFVTEEKDIRIQQFASGSIQEDEFFTVVNTNSTLDIGQRNMKPFLGLFRINTYQMLKLYLPKSFTNNLVISTSSGNVDFQNEIMMRNINVRMTSGNCTSGQAINASQITLVVTSGNIDLPSIVCQNYQIKSTSGNIKIRSLEGSGSVDGTSGNINLGNYKGAGSIHTTSGNITAELITLTGNLNVGLTSGDIRLSVGTDASFNLLASCVSGTIRGDLGMTVTNSGKAASANIGSNPTASLTVQATSGGITINRVK